MSIKSINEPDGPGRTTMITPQSINEPTNIPEGVGMPIVDALSQDSVTIGDDSFVLYVSGASFYDGSVIVFAGHDEPTTLEDDGTLSTGINMDVWLGPDTVKVGVRNITLHSNELDFTLLAAPEADTEVSDNGTVKHSRGQTTKSVPRNRRQR